MRKPFVAGNWKMNTDSHSSVELAVSLVSVMEQIAPEEVDVAICPPFVYLQQAIRAVTASTIAVGAQNVYYQDNGAYTGEISCRMLKDIGCTYVIIGHSERRHEIGETNDLINKKVSAAINGGLLPILCVGELLVQREAGQTEKVVAEQIENGFKGLSAGKFSAVTIAYEPVWAIGTGKTATPQQAQEMHIMIRKLVADIYDRAIAEQVRIQYGGSAKPDNAAELMAQPDVDGLLVGGASLKSDDFAVIIKAAAEAKNK